MFLRCESSSALLRYKPVIAYFQRELEVSVWCGHWRSKYRDKSAMRMLWCGIDTAMLLAFEPRHNVIPVEAQIAPHFDMRKLVGIASTTSLSSLFVDPSRLDMQPFRDLSGSEYLHCGPDYILTANEK